MLRVSALSRSEASRAFRSALPAALGFALLAGGGGALLAEAYEPTDPWPFVAVGVIAGGVALAARTARAALPRLPRAVWIVLPPVTVLAAVYGVLAAVFPTYLTSLLAHRWP